MKLGSNFDLSKVHNYHLLRFQRKRFHTSIYYFIRQTYLVIVTNLQWNSTWILQFFKKPIKWLVHIVEVLNSTMDNECIIFKKTCTYVFIINLHQSLIEKFKLCYSLQASIHSAPYKINHCDTKSDSCNHAFTQKLRKLALNSYSFSYATSPTW